MASASGSRSSGRSSRLQGGTVEAHSDGLGLGSEFIVRLPVAAEATEPPSRKPVAVPAATAGLRILIVDDNADGAESLAMLLQVGGYETHMAHDGLEAVEAADASASRCGAARHRPAEVERLRSVSPHPGAAVGKGPAAGGAHRLGHGGRPRSSHGGRFQRPPGQARGLRRPQAAACLAARPTVTPRRADVPASCPRSSRPATRRCRCVAATAPAHESTVRRPVADKCGAVQTASVRARLRFQRAGGSCAILPREPIRVLHEEPTCTHSAQSCSY